MGHTKDLLDSGCGANPNDTRKSALPASPDAGSDISLANILDPECTSAFGEYTYTEGSRFGPLLGPQLEMIYLRTGQVSIDCDQQKFEVTAPAFAVLASARKLEYRYSLQDTCDVAWCQWLDLGRTTDVACKLRPMIGVLPPSDTSVTLMTMGARLHMQLDDNAPAFTNALAIALFEEFFNRKRLATPKTRISPQVELIRHYIERSIEKPVCMATLSEVSGLSPQHLNRLYRAAHRENPLDYLWRLRTRRGAFLLQHTGIRISQIAYQTGFKSPNHFSRLIKQRFGLPPRALRARRWRGTDQSLEV